MAAGDRVVGVPPAGMGSFLVTSGRWVWRAPDGTSDVEAVSGMGALTRSSAERLARQLAQRGEVATDQVGDVVTELLERSRQNRQLLTTVVTSEVQRVIRTMGLATDEEVTALRRQVADLKRELGQLQQEVRG